MTFLGFTGLINFIFSAALAVLVYRKCPRRDVGFAYALMNLTIASFSAFYFLWQCASAAKWALFYLQMLTFSAMWINQSLLYFNGVFFGWTLLRRRIVWLAAVGNIFYSILNFARVMYPGVAPRFDLGYWPISVTGWFVSYLFFWHGELLFAFGDMLYSRQHLEGHKKDQVSYMIAAFAIGYFGGITNWPMWFGIHIPPYANILVSVYTVIVAYAMVKHHLMDINIVIRKTLLYSILSAALAAVYVGTITLLAQVLGSRHGPASVFSSALAAIFITLLFNPIRIRTQRWIDNRFPREHLDPELLQEAAGGFAHEMKRPLTKISLPAQLLLMELERVKNGKTAWREFLPVLEQRLKFIISQSSDAGYVIEAIRELSSSSAPFEAVDLRLAVDDALSANKDLLEKHGVTVSIKLLPDLPQILGRPKQLEIVFINLIKNAAEAMKGLPIGQKRELHIEGKADQHHVIVNVTDTGPGIRPEDKGKLFQPRYSTKGHQGTGLGLYFSQQIIQAHGSAIEVSSQEGCGAIFTVRLPVNTKTH